MTNNNALGATLVSLISSLIAWISLTEAQAIVTFGASATAIITGFFAARYYYYLTKKLKKK